MDTVPLLDIGAIEGDTAHQLFRVRGAVRLNDGVIIVANAGTYQLRMYGGDGDHIRNVGRQGEGPGEFQSLSWLGRYHRDSLVTWDARSRRISIFDRNGTFIRSASLNVRGAVRGVFGDGAVLVEEVVVRGSDGLRRNPSVLWHVSGDGTAIDSLGVFPGFEEIVRTEQVGSNVRVSGRSRPFGRQSVFGTSADVFVAGTQDRFELRRYSETGNLLAIIRLTKEYVPVTAADIAAFKQAVLARIVRGDPAAIRRELEELPYPEAMPAYGEILIDDAGNLWVEAYRTPGDDQPRWLVFDTADQLLGTVESPEGLKVFQIGQDFVLGMARDEFDVEHVRLHRLHKN